MTVYASDNDVRAYGAGLTLPADVSGATARGNHWVTRQVERAELVPSAGALVDLKLAAAAYALSTLAGNGLVSVGEQAVESVEVGPLKFKLGKVSGVATALPDFLTLAQGHLNDAGVGEANEDQVEVFTRPRRRW